MRSLSIFLFLLSLNFCHSKVSDAQQQIIQKHEQKISEQILQILEHYKKDDPVGIPGAPVPDPLLIPPLAHSFSLGKMNFENVKLYGLSKFRIHHIKADITVMKVEAALTIKTLDVKGNYTLRTFMSSAKGPFTVKLTDVYVKTIAALEITRSGQLEAQDMDMDITFKGIAMDFKGLGFFANMFQGVINSVGTFIFDSIKPFILREVNTNLRNDVNKQVRKIPQKFPNSISPFDQLIIDIRHKIRNAKYDPYKVNDYNTSVGVFDVYMRHTWLYGLSSIHRVGDITFEIKNNSVYALLEVGTQKMEGTSHWEVSLIAGFMSKAGTVSFSVEYLRVQLAISQTMDTRNAPKLEDIQLELGNIQIRFDGAGTVDYVIEFAVNVLPNLLRYQIMDALEAPVKQRIQQELDKVNIERMIKENVDKIDNPDSMKFL
ncbi:uncharacterized protein LOC123006459 [Tribolium madens]|uniref:uncharacterized protein LOC123006459 n=1 Tax=Tribolium madens TaxID=41895 RepID=UPI001CF751FD|nr:uncharacterized protein LOC123006459 [Tribolium madens]